MIWDKNVNDIDNGSQRSAHFEHCDFIRCIEACRKEFVFENNFPYFSTKRNVVDTQKNRRIETVLLSTQNTC